MGLLGLTGRGRNIWSVLPFKAAAMAILMLNRRCLLQPAVASIMQGVRSDVALGQYACAG